MQDKKESGNPFDKIEITNPNYGKGFIERNGKYYLQLVDGELEHSLEDIKNQITAHENMQEYYNVAFTKYSKILERPIGTLPKDFNSTVSADLFIDKIMKIYIENKESFGIENIVTQIEMLIDIQDEHIINPLLEESKEVNIYTKLRLEHLLKYWNKDKKTTTPDQVEESKKVTTGNGENSIFKNLSELFSKTEDFEFAISVLKNVEKPVIGDDDNYLLGKNSKGVFTAWIDILHKKSLIKTNEGTIIAPLLETYFKRLTITDRTLRANPTVAYNRYYTDFTTLFSSRVSS